ncbi:MAG: DUF1669 domain-containing protein [Anaerolineae bacterium]|nr:DUF1669 domain-containing protein [Anaerolineae bacterium]
MKPGRKSGSGNVFRNPMLALGLMLVFVVYLVKLMVDQQRREVSVPIEPNDQAALSVYFTRPESDGDRQIEEALVAALDGAQRCVDIAMHSFTLERVSAALLRARDRQVALRVVMESDSMDWEIPQRLKQTGIPILGDRRETLMHNKFMVVDDAEVWSGSLNWTKQGVFQDHNNLIRIRSPYLAKNYTLEFEEMFLDDMFGENSPANTPYPFLTIGGAYVETHFSPEDGVEKKLVTLIDSARQDILFLMYSFTSDALAQAIISRVGAGVAVRGVMDADQVVSNQGSEYDRLQAAGVDVRLDGNAGQMHHKVLIIDGNIVVTGSYNFSKNAETRNDENVLIIHDQQVAAEYQKEFEKLYAAAK